MPQNLTASILLKKPGRKILFLLFNLVMTLFPSPARVFLQHYVSLGSARSSSQASHCFHSYLALLAVRSIPSGPDQKMPPAPELRYCNFKRRYLHRRQRSWQNGESNRLGFRSFGHRHFIHSGCKDKHLLRRNTSSSPWR